MVGEDRGVEPSNFLPELGVTLVLLLSAPPSFIKDIEDISVRTTAT
jgi:hypothetical protein